MDRQKPQGSWDPEKMAQARGSYPAYQSPVVESTPGWTMRAPVPFDPSKVGAGGSSPSFSAPSAGPTQVGAFNQPSGNGLGRQGAYDFRQGAIANPGGQMHPLAGGSGDPFYERLLRQFRQGVGVDLRSGRGQKPATDWATVLSDRLRRNGVR